MGLEDNFHMIIIKFDQECKHNVVNLYTFRRSNYTYYIIVFLLSGRKDPPHLAEAGPEVIKTMRNSVEHGIFLLINFKMPTVVGILHS